MESVKIIECPRDAMQGIKPFIPTDEKAKYIQSLLRCGFDTIDFGSFVSPKAIPQMQDTAKVLDLLDLSETQSKLLAIVANVRGAKDASVFPEIDYLGYPFSISENFQMRNTHKTIAESVEVLKSILEIAEANNKSVVAYLLQPTSITKIKFLRAAAQQRLKVNLCINSSICYCSYPLLVGLTATH